VTRPQRFLLVASIVVATAAAAAAAASTDDATRFVAQMFRGVGVAPAQCAESIAHDASSRSMNAVCATFDGDFEEFRAMWALSLLVDAYADERDDAGPVPQYDARTDWEPRGDAHERIYRVGASVVGVRFSRGDVIVVWTDERD